MAISARQSSAAAKGGVDDAAAHVLPLFNLELADHDDVHRDENVVEGSPQANGLLDTVLDLGLDDQQVEVAVTISPSCGVRAKRARCATTGRRRAGAARLR